MSSRETGSRVSEKTAENAEESRQSGVGNRESGKTISDFRSRSERVSPARRKPWNQPRMIAEAAAAMGSMGGMGKMGKVGRKGRQQ
jgi:hypothetical protein